MFVPLKGPLDYQPFQYLWQLFQPELDWLEKQLLLLKDLVFSKLSNLSHQLVEQCHSIGNWGPSLYLRALAQLHLQEEGPFEDCS